MIWKINWIESKKELTCGQQSLFMHACNSTSMRFWLSSFIDECILWNIKLPY